MTGAQKITRMQRSSDRQSRVGVSTRVFLDFKRDLNRLEHPHVVRADRNHQVLARLEPRHVMPNFSSFYGFCQWVQPRRGVIV